MVTVDFYANFLPLLDGLTTGLRRHTDELKHTRDSKRPVFLLQVVLPYYPLLSTYLENIHFTRNASKYIDLIVELTSTIAPNDIILFLIRSETNDGTII